MMQLTEHHAGELISISSYDDAGVVIEGERFEESVAFAPQGPVQPWDAPDHPGALDDGHAAGLLELEPEVVILATGARTVIPPAAFLAEFGRRGVGVEAMDTGAACRTYNVLVSEGRRVVAAFFL